MTPVIVVGGGLIGLATAQALVERGLAVHLLEAQGGVGDGTSFANGGLVTPSMSEPWNAPGAYRHFAASLFDPAAPMKLRIGALPGLIGWGVEFLRASTPARFLHATEASFRLAVSSLNQMRTWRERLALDYDCRARGSLSVFRRGGLMHEQLRLSAHLQPLGLRYQALDADAAVGVEPLLAAAAADITGAIFFPDDEVGDSHALCVALAAAAARGGARIDTARRATRIVTHAGRVAGVEVEGELVAAEQVVVAAGVDAAALLSGVGVRIAVAPAKGYSLTVDLSQLDAVPTLPVLDGRRHAVVTPLGRRLRIAGTAEFAGFDLRLRPERIAPLAACMRELYPQLAHAADPAQGIPWTGLRPVSADGLPYIGQTRIAGLYVNAGHGALGLTHAAGSGALLAALLQGGAPAVDPQPYSPLRHS